MAVPYVVLLFAGIGLMGFTNTTSTLIVDTNPVDVGAATASFDLTRCLVGADASAAIQLMIVGVYGVGGSQWSRWAAGIVGCAEERGWRGGLRGLERVKTKMGR